MKPYYDKEKRTLFVTPDVSFEFRDLYNVVLHQAVTKIVKGEAQTGDKATYHGSLDGALRYAVATLPHRAPGIDSLQAMLAGQQALIKAAQSAIAYLPAKDLYKAAKAAQPEQMAAETADELW